MEEKGSSQWWSSIKQKGENGELLTWFPQMASPWQNMFAGFPELPLQNISLEGCIASFVSLALKMSSSKIYYALNFFLLISLIENLFYTLYSDSSFPPLLLSVPSYWPPHLHWSTSFVIVSLESSHLKNNIRLKYNTIRWNKNEQVRIGQKNQRKSMRSTYRQTHMFTHVGIP